VLLLCDHRLCGSSSNTKGGNQYLLTVMCVLLLGFMRPSHCKTLDSTDCEGIKFLKFCLVSPVMYNLIRAPILCPCTLFQEVMFHILRCNVKCISYSLRSWFSSLWFKCIASMYRRSQTKEFLCCKRSFRIWVDL